MKPSSHVHPGEFYATVPMFIYVLRDPRTGLARYVGVTTNPKRRVRQHKHIAAAQKTFALTAWKAELRAERLAPELVVVERVEGIDRAGKAERRWVEELRASGMQLFNDVEHHRPPFTGRLPRAPGLPQPRYVDRVLVLVKLWRELGQRCPIPAHRL